MIDGMTTTPPQAVAKYQADIRAHIFYTRPGNDDPDLEVTFSTKGAFFAIPPAKGDHFLPGYLSPALLNAELTPIIKHIEHVPELSFRPGGAGACVVITCTSLRVPDDDLVNALRAERWDVQDFRRMNEMRQRERELG